MAAESPPKAAVRRKRQRVRRKQHQQGREPWFYWRVDAAVGTQWWHVVQTKRIALYLSCAVKKTGSLPWYGISIFLAAASHQGTTKPPW